MYLFCYCIRAILHTKLQNILCIRPKLLRSSYDRAVGVGIDAGLKLLLEIDHGCEAADFLRLTSSPPNSGPTVNHWLEK